jgi:signal transduction histidine kinase
MTPVNISKRISKAIEGLSQLGTNENFSSWDNNKTRYLNLLLLVSSLSAFCFLVANYFLDNNSLASLGGLILVFNILLYILQYYQRQYLARTLTYACYPILFYFIIIASKGDVHGEYAFFLMILLSVMFFRTRWRQFSMLLYVLVLFIAAQVNVYQYATAPSLQAILNDTVIFLAIGTGLILITDSFITQIIETRRNNKQLLLDLSTSNEELRRLNYMVSHDLRTPLRQIVSFSDLALIANKEKDTVAIQDYIEQVGLSARTLYTLTDDLLSLAHLDNKQLPTEDLSVAEVFAKAKQQFASLEDTITIETEDKGHKFIGNATLLGMVLQNLIENGLKYNEQPTKYIHLHASSHPEGLQISVQDNGIGIAHQHQDKIFEPFLRLPTKESYQGTGLGLAIAKKIMDIHGGKISLESSGQGTKFILTFPHRLVEKEQDHQPIIKSSRFKIWQTFKQRRAIF